MKTPLEFVASAARAVNANVQNAQPIIQALRTDLGMPLYGCQPPTGYSMTADAWVNTGALLNRMNFAVQLLAGGFPQRQPVAGRGGQPGAPADGPPNRPNRPNAAGRQGQPGPLQLRPAQLARAPIQVDPVALAPDTTEASRDQVIRVDSRRRSPRPRLARRSRAPRARRPSWPSRSDRRSSRGDRQKARPSTAGSWALGSSACQRVRKVRTSALGASAFGLRR